MSQPEAVSNIAVPTFETMLAVHMIVNAVWPNAPHREGVRSVDVAVEFKLALKLFSERLARAPGASERRLRRLVCQSAVKVSLFLASNNRFDALLTLAGAHQIGMPAGYGKGGEPNPKSNPNAVFGRTRVETPDEIGQEIVDLPYWRHSVA